MSHSYSILTKITRKAIQKMVHQVLAAPENYSAILVKHAGIVHDWHEARGRAIRGLAQNRAAFHTYLALRREIHASIPGPNSRKKAIATAFQRACPDAAIRNITLTGLSYLPKTHGRPSNLHFILSTEQDFITYWYLENAEPQEIALLYQFLIEGNPALKAAEQENHGWLWRLDTKDTAALLAYRLKKTMVM